MKPKDVAFAALVVALFAPFFFSPAALAAYKTANAQHPLLLSFLKFAVLATLGECLGLRIRTGCYNQPGFGILPRAVVWGVLGLAIKAPCTAMAWAAYSMPAAAPRRPATRSGLRGSV